MGKESGKTFLSFVFFLWKKQHQRKNAKSDKIEWYCNSKI